MSQLSLKKRIIKRLEWIYQVEGMNVVMFLGVLIFLNLEYGFRNLIFLTYGLFWVCYILFQGTYYWWKKLSVLKGEHICQEKILKQFRLFKKQNIAGLILAPIILGCQWYLSGKQLSSDNLLIWAVIANLFAACEYINYYHTQLMYDNRYDLNYLLKNRQLKEASLRKDLRENSI